MISNFTILVGSSSPPSPERPVSTTLDKLGAFQAGTVRPQACFDLAYIVASHPATNSLTDSILTNWYCSVSAAFVSFPRSFVPLVIAREYTALSFADRSVGIPYIFVRGEAVSLFAAETAFWIGRRSATTATFATGTAAPSTASEKFVAMGLSGWVRRVKTAA
jgi:hypothetical protein